MTHSIVVGLSGSRVPSQQAVRSLRQDGDVKLVAETECPVIEARVKLVDASFVLKRAGAGSPDRSATARSCPWSWFQSLRISSLSGPSAKQATTGRAICCTNDPGRSMRREMLRCCAGRLVRLTAERLARSNAKRDGLSGRCVDPRSDNRSAL